MKKISLYEESGFNDLHMNRFLVHDSPYFKVLNFKGMRLNSIIDKCRYSH